MLLETLDDVPWHRLHHAYGPANDVPQTLRALAGDDADDRKNAIHELYGNIFHQGTRYEATIHAIPFLLHMAANPDVPDRAEILDLLAHVALGYPDDGFLPWGVNADRLRESLRSADRAMGSQDREACRTYGFGPLVDLACYDGVQAGLDTLLPLISASDDDIGCAAAYLFGWFPDVASSSLPRLFDSASNARSDRTRAHSLIAIGLLSGDRLNDRQAEHISTYCGSNYSLLVRTAAAIAIFKSRWAASAQKVLIEALQGAKSLSFRSDHLLFNEGNLAGQVAMMLSDAPENMHDQLVPALCSMLEMADPYQSLDITRALLDLATGAASERQGYFARKSASQLTDWQREALESICDHGGWKLEVCDFVNYSELVEHYGLPRNREKLQTYLRA